MAQVLAFTKAWTGLEKEQLHFYPPHIFCNGNRGVEREWTPGGGGWHRDGRWWARRRLSLRLISFYFISMVAAADSTRLV